MTIDQNEIRLAVNNRAAQILAEQFGQFGTADSDEGC